VLSLFGAGVIRVLVTRVLKAIVLFGGLLLPLSRASLIVFSRFFTLLGLSVSLVVVE
jgi:hypothetical protein